MQHKRPHSICILGFLTVVEHPEQGLFGGYLLLNHTGRPLEFHCTAPLRPNRAQEILYGPSLGPFLYGEQIGATLVRHAKATPCAVLTDSEPALAMGEHLDVPVALVLPPDPADTFTADPEDARAHLLRLDTAHNAGPTVQPHRTGDGKLVLFDLGRHRLAVPCSCEAHRNAITDRLTNLPESFDLVEPFGRIHEAISEARKGVR